MEVLGRCSTLTHRALMAGWPTCMCWVDNLTDITLQHVVVTVLVMFATSAKGSRVPFLI
jgi:hypothetical protein